MATPFINLEQLEAGDITLASLVATINDNLSKLDSHDHTSGRGREIPLSSIIADSSINMNENSVLNADFISFLNRTVSVPQNGTLFFKAGELFVRDFSGREIQLSFEGGLAQGSPGKVRGQLIATSPPLATAGLSVNTDVSVAWTFGEDLPAGKYAPGVTTGVIADTTSVVVPEQFGYVIDAEVGGSIVNSVVIPYGNIPKDLTDSTNQDTEFFLRVSSSQGIAVEYRRGVTDRLNLQYLSATLPENTVVKIYEAVVRGAPGPQGIRGQIGPTGNALTQAQRATLEKAVEVDSITLSNDNDLFFASNSGRATTINLNNVASEINPVTVRDKLQELSGNDRLDASAVKNLPAPTAPVSPETGITIRDKLETLQGVSRLPASAIQGLSDGRLIGLNSLPSDFSSYSHGQVLWINGTPRGMFIEVRGANDNERHSFAVDFVADPNNPTRNTWVVGSQISYGVSFTTSRFGNEYTADRGKPYTASNAPVRSMVIELMVTRLPATGVHLAFSSSATMTIPKVQLVSAPNTIVARYYSGPPSSDNQVATVEFVKSADNPAHNYHTYTERLADQVPSDVADIESIRYFNLFTASPATNDQSSNPLQLHSSKGFQSIDPVQSGAEIVNQLTSLQAGARLPASAIRDLPSGGGQVNSTFVGLTDTPASYSGQRGKFLKVNASEHGLEFQDTLSGNDIKSRLEALSGTARLNASAINGLIQGKTDSQVNALINAIVSTWARIGNSDYLPSSKAGRVMTQSAYTALQTKENIIYYVTE